MSIKAELAPMHPGEILDELYLTPLNLSAGALAKRLGVPRTRIERLVKGSTGVTTDTALRLGRFFRSSPDMWLNMQTSWDLVIERAETIEELNAIEPLEQEVA